MELYDTIIIGGGPAGLTAGIYSARARMKVLLIEGSAPGGQIVLTDIIENYPGFPNGISGMELVDNMKKQALSFGLEVASGEVKGIKESKTEDGRKCWELETTEKKFNSLSVVVASGGFARKLGIPGEKEFLSRGVSYCATCDGAFFKGKEVIVAGGGNAAVEEALFLTKFASKVKIVHRRDRLRASKILAERAEAEEKIEFVWNSVITEITGDQKVRSVKLKDVKTDKERDLPCDGVFIFIGYIPNTAYLKGVIDLDERGYVTTDNDMKTSKDGIYACGDCRNKTLLQVVTACGEGAQASFSAKQYVDDIKGIAYK